MLKKLINRKTASIAACIFVLCLIFIYAYRDYLFLNPFEPVAYEGVIYASLDEKGNTYVIDSAGARLIKVSPEGGLVWRLESSSGLFHTLTQVVPIGDRIYVHESWLEEGIRLGGERILELDSSGKLLATIADYPYTGKDVLQAHIIGMSPAGDELAFIRKTPEDVRLVMDGKPRIMPFPNAEGILQRATYDHKEQAVYYTTMDGKVCRLVEGKSPEVLYSCTELKEKTDPAERSIPFDLSFADGMLYVADIGLRDILAIDPAVPRTERYLEEADFFSKEINYHVSGLNGLVAATDYSVKKYQGSYSYIYENSCEPSASQRLMAFLVKAFSLIALLILAGFLLYLLVNLIKNGNSYNRIILGVIVSSIAMASLIVGVMLPQFQDRMTEAFFERTGLAGSVVASQLDKEAFVRLNGAEDTFGEDYNSVKGTVDSVFISRNDSMRDLYCCLYQVIDNVICMTYSMTGSRGAVYPYDWAYEGSTEEQVLTTKEGVEYYSNNSEGEYLFTYDPICDEEGNPVGIIEVGKDMISFRKEVNRMVMDVFINVLALTAVTILSVIEVISLIKGRNEFLAKEEALGKGKVEHLPPEIMRMVAFLVYFLTNLCTAFLPNYAMEISREVEGLAVPAEVMAAFPISAEVIAGAFFSVFGVSLIERLGEKRAVFLCSLFFTGGFALRIIPSIWMLILGNAIMGMGWGVVLLSTTMRIAALPEEEKDRGFSYYSVAALNGINCGVVFGGFLVNWMDYRMVFIITMLLSLSILIITMRYYTGAKKEKARENEEKKNNIFRTIAFILNPQVFTLLFMIVGPIMICYYFLNYLYPIIGLEYGLSESYIGYSYLLNGLCVMIFGGILTKFFTSRRRKREGLFLACILYALAFLLVAVFHNVASLFAALALLGISDSFGLPLQSGFYTDLNVVNSFGQGKALGIYNLVVNVGETIGPFVFSYVLLAGVSNGLMLVLTVLSCLAAGFLIIGKFLDRKAKRGNE